jgi:hypothetical protein
MQDHLNLILKDTTEILKYEDHIQLNRLWAKPELADSIAALSDWASLQDANSEQRRFALDHAVRLVTAALREDYSASRHELRELLVDLFEQRFRFTAVEMARVLGAGAAKAELYPNPKDQALVEGLDLRGAYEFSTLTTNEQKQALRLAAGFKKNGKQRGLTRHLVEQVKNKTRQPSSETSLVTAASTATDSAPSALGVAHQPPGAINFEKRGKSQTTPHSAQIHCGATEVSDSSTETFLPRKMMATDPAEPAFEPAPEPALAGDPAGDLAVHHAKQAIKLGVMDLATTKALLELLTDHAIQLGIESGVGSSAVVRYFSDLTRKVDPAFNKARRCEPVASTQVAPAGTQEEVAQ